MFDVAQDPLRELREFAALYGEALQNAALVLGCRPALRRTQALLDDIAEAPRLTNRLRRELAAINALLTLQNVHDLEGIEAGCFADIDPDSPLVADLCLLAEALQDVLSRADCAYFPDHRAA